MGTEEWTAARVWRELVAAFRKLPTLPIYSPGGNVFLNGTTMLPIEALRSGEIVKVRVTGPLGKPPGPREHGAELIIELLAIEL